MECFAIWAKKIENRIDPFFYSRKFIQLINKLQNTNNLNLGSIIEFANEIWNQEDFFGNDFPYIEISEIDIDAGEIQNINYIEKRKAPSRAKMIVRENDIIVSTTRPHRGAIAFIDKEKDGFIASTGFQVLRKIKVENVNKEYLLFFLRTQLSLKQMLQRSSGGNYPAITSEELKKLIIPIPSLDKQIKIIKLMHKAYTQRKIRESEAQKLLDSTNEYTIQELNLDFYKKGKQFFYVDSNQIINRLDPLYYSIDVYFFLEKSKYPITTIGEVYLMLKTGFAAGKDDQDLENKGIIQIRPTNISKTRQLIFDKCIYISNEEKESLTNELIQQGEILFNNTNSQELVGKSTYFDIPGDYCCSNHITRIKVDPDRVNPIFLTQLLNTYQLNNLFFRICTNWNNQSGVNIELLKTVKIPLPPIDVQNKIAEEVKRRMQKAEQLQKEANEELDKAKTEMEKIILGRLITL